MTSFACKLETARLHSQVYQYLLFCVILHTIFDEYWYNNSLFGWSVFHGKAVFREENSLVNTETPQTVGFLTVLKNHAIVDPQILSDQGLRTG